MLNIYYNSDLTIILGGIFMKKFIFIVFVVISIIFTINTAYANWFKESNNQLKETTNVNGYTVTTFKLVTVNNHTGSHTEEDYYILIIKSPNGKTTEVLTNCITTIKLL